MMVCLGGTSYQPIRRPNLTDLVQETNYLLTYRRSLSEVGARQISTCSIGIIIIESHAEFTNDESFK